MLRCHPHAYTSINGSLSFSSLRPPRRRPRRHRPPLLAEGRYRNRKPETEPPHPNPTQLCKLPNTVYKIWARSDSVDLLVLPSPSSFPACFCERQACRREASASCLSLRHKNPAERAPPPIIVALRAWRPSSARLAAARCSAHSQARTYDQRLRMALALLSGHS
jgi:hypothetical protein